MAGKTTMKLEEIKPKVAWNQAQARDLLIKMGAAQIKKVANTPMEKSLGAVKCTDKGGGMIEFEWSGNLPKLNVEEIIRY